MTVRIDALDRSLVPQQPITWQLLDISTLQYNTTGAFSLVVPATPRNWELVTFDSQGEFVPFALYVDWNGVFEVPLLAEQWEHNLVVDPNTGLIFETITFSGADMLVLLANRVVYPDGTQTWADQSTTPRTLTGPAETVIKTLVTENMVTAGDSDRIVPNFTVAADQGRGGTVTYTITPPVPSAAANLLTGTNAAGFEDGTGNWTGVSNCSIARTSARFHSGGWSLAVTASGSGSMTTASCTAASILTNGCPVRQGDSVTASAWLRAASTAETCTVGIDWYDDTGTFLSSDTSGGKSDKTTGWVQISGTFAAPDTAVLARLNVQVQGAAPGEVHYLDDCALTDNGLQAGAGRYGATLGNQLMNMVREVAAQSPIGVQITLDGTNLVFDCYIPQDLSGKAVFSTSLGNLRGDTVSDAVPTADVVLLEDGASPPNFTEHDAPGPAATDPWRRAEKFDDQTSTTTAADLTSAVTQDLEAGQSVHQLVITATDIPLLRFGRTIPPVQGYNLGDTVTVAIREGVSYTDIISAVELTAGSQTAGTSYTGSTTGVQVTGSSYGTYYELVTPTVGTPSASSTDQSALSRLAAQVRRIDKAVARATKAGQ